MSRSKNKSILEVLDEIYGVGGDDSDRFVFPDEERGCRRRRALFE